ncbi:Integral membrane protein [Colletotrichum asianum]
MASINASGILPKEAQEVAMMVFDYLVKDGTRLDATTLRRFAQEDIKLDRRRNVSYLNEDEIDIRRRYVSEIQLILLTDESIWVLSEAEQELFQQVRFWALLWTTELDRLESIHATLTRNDDDPDLPSAKLYLATDIKKSVLKTGAYGGYATCRADLVGDKTENIARNESAAKRASDRDDNKCVATGCNKFQVCHFAAFFGINRPTAIQELLDAMKVLIGPQAFRDLEVKLVGGDNIIDTPRNMVTLTHKLHKYMDDAIFGLEPLREISRPKPEVKASGESNGQETNTGSTTGDSRTQGHVELQTGDASLESPDLRSGTSAGLPTGDVNLAASMDSPSRRSVRVMESNLKRKTEAEAEAKRIQTREEERKAEEMTQHGLEICCHWLPRTNLRCWLDKAKDFGADPREMMDEWSAANYEFRTESGRPLNSRMIITIWADKKADLPDFGVMNFFFHALCFHRLSGGADTRIYRPWTHYDKDDPGHTYASDPRREAERRILEILAEDDKAGGVYDADRRRKVQERMVQAVAELEITHAEEVSSNTPTESREAWIAPHLRHKYGSDQSSASSKGGGRDQDEQEPAAPRD